MLIEVSVEYRETRVSPMCIVEGLVYGVMGRFDLTYCFIDLLVD